MKTYCHTGLFLAFFLILCCYSPTPTAQPLDYPTTANLSTTWTINLSFPDYRYATIDENITSGGRLNPILHRKTNLTRFALGFFCQGNDYECTSYLFAIFILSEYSSTPSPLVWSANRDFPVHNNATLNFSAAGELVLRDADGRKVWTTNTAGNLVLYDVSNQVVWQSFDHPTDCLLPGQELYQGQKLISSSVSLANWTSQKGMFSLQVTDKGLVAYVDSNPPQAYFSYTCRAGNCQP